jgi:predicted HicB family RNase H-like nuclease
MPSKISEAQRRANDKYISGFDEIKVRVEKGSRDLLKYHAARRGMSLNGYICDLIQQDLERNGVLL